MARKATEDAAVVDPTTAVDNIDGVSVKEIKAENKATKSEKVSKTLSSVKKVAFEDDDEFDVYSLVPNVSYKDKTTDDVYEWGEVGDSNTMTYASIKLMWKNHKDYFKNLLLKPDNKELLESLGVGKLYADYEVFTDPKNYTAKNVADMVVKISEARQSVKDSICRQVKVHILSGEISDLNVIKALDVALEVGFLDLMR